MASRLAHTRLILLWILLVPAMTWAQTEPATQPVQVVPTDEVPALYSLLAGFMTAWAFWAIWGWLGWFFTQIYKLLF
jgi:hypothetical protein